MHPHYIRPPQRAQDRAARLVTAILLILRSAFLRWLTGEAVNFASVRAEIETTVRQELDDAERAVLKEFRE